MAIRAELVPTPEVSMRLSDWWSRAPHKDSMTPKVLAVIEPVLASLAAESDAASAAKAGAKPATAAAKPAARKPAAASGARAAGRTGA